MSSLAFRSFAGGEIAPALYARTDQTKYATGLRTCRNFLVQRHGGVANRPGTDYVANTKGNGVIEFFKFVRSADQTYLLEFGNLYIRFHQNGAPVVVSGVAAWSAVTAYGIGSLVTQGGVTYYAILGGTNHVPPNATYWYPLTGSIYEIPTPYLAAELADIDYVQSVDVITLVHPLHPPMNLSRFGHTNWRLEALTFAPRIRTPQNVVLDPATGSGSFRQWVVTAIDANTGQESLASAIVGISAPALPQARTILWDVVPGAQRYNVYRGGTPDGTNATDFYFIGSTSTTQFYDDSVIPADYTLMAPVARNPFVGAGNYPSAITNYQQRRLLAHTVDDPETVFGSRTGDYDNYTVSIPLLDDDAVTFSLAGRQVSAVQHMLDLGRLVLFTETGVWIIGGDQAGIIRPGEVNPKQYLYNGAARLSPVIVGNSALYLQARGTIVRDLVAVATDSYQGNDLTVFAPHLFDDWTLIDWDYQETPHSVIWAVRSDGVLLGLTYLREHAIWGWHHHDTDGVIEDVCCLPEGDEDRVYVCVRREINGLTKRYIERMALRQFTDVEDAHFVDCALAYDGWNTTTETMQLGGGTTWESDEEIFIATDGAFPVDAIGNSIFLRAADGSVIRFALEREDPVLTFVLWGHPDRTVPADLRVSLVTDWAYAVDEVSGLDHLEGKAVSVFADGVVVASPNNADYDEIVVTGGTITLPSDYARVLVGLPYLSDFATLDIDTTEGPSLKASKSLINLVALYVERTRGLFYGQNAPTDDDADPLENLSEPKVRDAEDYDSPVSLLTGILDAVIEARWDANGRIFVRQVDPLPATILAAIPQGKIARAR